MILKPLYAVSMALVFLSACAFTGSDKKATTATSAKPVVMKTSQQKPAVQKAAQVTCTADKVCTLPSLKKYQKKP